MAETTDALAAARAIASSGRISPPLVDSPKCPRCSLVGICLPDETRKAMGLVRPAEKTQPSLFGVDDETPADRPLDDSPQDEEIRRLVPARDDLRPLYVTGRPH